MFSSPLSTDQREACDRTDGIVPLKVPVNVPICFTFSAAELDGANDLGSVDQKLHVFSQGACGLSDNPVSISSPRIITPLR